MTEDVDTMRNSITRAIEEFLARNGGGFANGFVYAVDVVDSDGERVKYIGGPLEQDTGSSLGLVSYLDKWYDTEARELIARSAGSCNCDQCTEDDS